MNWSSANEKCSHELRMDSVSPTSIERDKNNNQIFERLLTFGSEPDRALFCQRLQTIWEEQGIFCQSYPMITNQILDLYKLHKLVQEKQGFGDSGSAAYSVKRNYVRLGLLTYECRYDQPGIDPRTVIELSEMPHTVKKRRRGNNTSTPTRTNLKVSKQQQHQMISTQYEQDDMKNTSIEIQKNSFRLTPQQMPVNNVQHFAYVLRAGYLADSNRYLDTLLVWLSDARTASYFNLKYIPGLFNAIMEQYIACLYELYGQSFLQSVSPNDYYMNWFIQSKFRLNDDLIGPCSSPDYLESLFYGKYRYIIKQLINKNEKQDVNRYYSLIIRCSCLTTIVRNLSFIEENEYLANDNCLLDILERILTCHHDNMHDIYDSSISIDTKIPHSSSYLNDDDQRHLMYLLDNTFVTLANFAPFIKLDKLSSEIRYRLINTIIHWINCSLSFSNNIFISMITEDKLKQEEIFISPKQICLQILAKLCTNELNVDYILQNLDNKNLKILCEKFLSMMNTLNQDDINREYCLIIIYSLCKRHRPLIEVFCSNISFIELIFNYLEYYEFNQQQYLIATLTSCYNSSSSSTMIPINNSNDMIIDTCIQLLVLFSTIKENNCLKVFEYKILDMSSSIYFEQRLLKNFAEILYLLKS